MIQFIKDVRRDLETPDLPFVIAETGMSGLEESILEHFHSWQHRKPLLTTPTSKEMSHLFPPELYRPPDDSPSKQAYHWNNNAETYYLIGQHMAHAMIRLMKP